MSPERRALTTIVLVLAACTGGCARLPEPVPIAKGTPCALCGMEVSDLGFACERARKDGVRIYDSIECLLRDRPVAGDRVYLTDYDSRALHRADSLWIVKGYFPTPMGGGLACFLSRSAANEVAVRAHGRVGAWSAAMELLGSAP